MKALPSAWIRGLTMLACVLWSAHSFSQTVYLKGKVVHEKSGEPLPFVNIIIQGSRRGTTTDVEGRFILTLFGTDRELAFSYLGFETYLYRPSQPPESYVVIALKEKPLELREVVIHAGENPAFRIIRNATQNKPINDPEKLSSFTYHSYNRLVLTTEGAPDTSREKSIQRFKDFVAQHDLFVGESYTEKKYVSPHLSKETVLANQVSGVKDPFFTFLATDVQPFSFYEDYIKLLDRNYLNPLSAGSTEKYSFMLTDTVFHGADSIFVIAFEPLPGKTFDAMKGQLYITSDGFALEHVLAQPADDQALLEFRVQQKYEKVDGHWFPVQLNSELRFKQYQIGGKKLVYVSRSYLKDIIIGPNVSHKEFGLLNVVFDPNANHRIPEFWATHRADSLDRKAASTYQFYDSLGPKLRMVNTAMKIAENLALGRFKLGPFYLPVEHLGRINQYEGTRMGLGIQTGEAFSRYFSVEGNAGYGIRDRAWKYGGALQINLLPARDVSLRYSYQQDIVEPGHSDFLRSPITGNESLRNWLAARMDSVTRHKVELGFHAFRFSQVSFFAQRQLHKPTYRYAFHSAADPLGLRQDFMAVEIGLQFRWAWNEQYIQIGNGKAVTKMAYPQINLYASQGVAAWSGQYHFTKMEIRLDHQWMTRGLGQTTVQLAAGKIIGQLPYPFLFSGKGSHFDYSLQNNFYINNYFQTMGLYEFASDQFAYLFLQQHLGRLTGNQSKYFRPELSIVHHSGVGSMQNPAAHTGVLLKTMNKGFFESGVLITNLLRVNYVNLLYLGLGAGTFYRYGEYALPKASDNLAWRLIVTFTF